MSEFSNESSTQLSWRDHPHHHHHPHQLDRDTSAGLSSDHVAHHHQSTGSHHHHHSSQRPLYENYTPPPAISEAEGWSTSTSHDNQGMVGSPHSQASSGSIMDSPLSDSRRSLDMGAGSGQSSHEHMSLSDRRNEKRKMKRFRLTHSQTRFLMSEFARQAHPDAAHRERLAREIPGLSPRQVQVWFQNRRAKLKRMSSDDRERMMKSRALPEEFPILQTLHTYNARMMGTPVASPTEYSPTSYHRPDHLRRRHMEDDVSVSPNNAAYSGLSYGSSTPPPGDMMSPGSNAERSGYMGYLSAPTQRGNPFSRTTDPYRTHPTVPRLQLHETPRSLGDTPSSPATPYTGGSNLGHDDYQHSPGGYSLQNIPYDTPRSVPLDTPASPYVHSNTASAGFSHQQSYPSPAPPSSHGGRPSPYPPPLTLSEFKYSQPPLTPHTGTLSGFATAPLAPPQEYQIPQMSAPADATTFSSSYLSRNAPASAQTGPTSTSADSPHHDREPRLVSVENRDFTQQRRRSSSHPPSFPHSRES